MAFWRHFTALAAFLTLIAHIHPASAQERIRSFDADISITEYGDLQITETVTVVSEQQNIQRGIIRNLPVRYKDAQGKETKTDYTILGVTRSGAEEPYKVSKSGAYLNIRIGSPDKRLRPGEHRYVLRYIARAQVAFNASYDALYWNVTGDKWRFPIERASARVTLPNNWRITETRGYTGAYGASENNSFTRSNPDGSVSVVTTKRLAMGEGLTVAARWPKGLIKEPSAVRRFIAGLQDDTLVVVLSGYVGLLCYFLMTWLYVGRDPKPGPLVPLYYPPANLGPAALRYVREMQVDDKALTTTILSLAVKRYLTVSEHTPDEYSLERTFLKHDKLTKAERAVADALFKDGPARFDVDRANHERLGKAKRALKAALKGDYEAAYFKLNTIYVLIGVLIGGGLVVWLNLSTPDAGPAIGLSIWLCFWGLSAYRVIARLKTKWLMAVRRASLAALLKALFRSVPAVILLVGFCLGGAAFAAVVSLHHAAIVILILITCLAFYHWMKAPTRRGRALLDKIDGFRAYLMLAEKDRMNFHNPPEVTPQVFEQYLPHAMAMDVEHDWSMLFEETLSAAAATGEKGDYHPAWYAAGGRRSFSANAFSQHLGSQFSNSISAAAKAPARSSGSAFSSGGGFSGGGAGGGGGSGW